MSWYYAENNNQRGPVDDAAFQELVRNGTVRPETLVWREGLPSWVPYAQVGGGAGTAIAVPALSAGAGGVRCSECGGFFAENDVITIAGRTICAACKPRAVQQMVEGAGATGTAFDRFIDPEQFLAEVRARGGYRLDAGDVLSRSWNLVKANLWPCIGATLLVYFTMVTAQQLCNLVGACLVSGPCLGGLFYYFLLQIRGKRSEVGDAFLGFKQPQWGQLALAGTVQTLVPLLIVAVLIVPAIIYSVSTARSGAADFPVGLVLWCFVAMLPFMYLTLAWKLGYAFIIDKGLSFWPAMELSRKLVNMRLGGWIVLMLLNGLLAMAGFLAVCVGVIFVLPVTVCTIVVVYEDILAQRST